MIDDIENILVNMKSFVRENALADLFHVMENVRMIWKVDTTYQYFVSKRMFVKESLMLVVENV